MIELWIEGMMEQGMEHPSKASFLGYYETDNLKEAVRMYANTLKDKRSRSLVNIEALSFWGCHFFDNETDARKRFG